MSQNFCSISFLGFHKSRYQLCRYSVAICSVQHFRHIDEKKWRYRIFQKNTPRKSGSQLTRNIQYTFLMLKFGVSKEEKFSIPRDARNKWFINRPKHILRRRAFSRGPVKCRESPQWALSESYSASMWDKMCRTVLRHLWTFLSKKTLVKHAPSLLWDVNNQSNVSTN